MSMVQQVIDRLKATPGVRQVQGAVELAAAISASNVATPTLFVVPMRDSAGRDQGFTGDVTQQVQSALAIVFVVDNKRDATGAAAINDLEPLRIAVRKQLLGWAPPGMDAPFTTSGGQLIDMASGRVWWGDDYLIDQLWSSE